MRFTVTGGTPNAEATIAAGLAEGLRDALEHLRAVSMQQVPYEEGVLQNSASVDVDTSGAVLHGTVSYDTPYAARQHEETGWQHTNGRKAKYLEDPMNAERARMGQAIARRARFDG